MILLSLPSLLSASRIMRKRSFFAMWLTIAVFSARCDGYYNVWEFMFGPKLGAQQWHKEGRSTTPRSAEIIARNFGYRLDVHLVASETGHILTLHRIPQGRKPHDSTNKTKPIAFIHHGLLGSSDMWLLRGPDHDLPYILADSGYDVWLFNVRGNVYSRRHKTLNPDRDKEYWDFGVEDIGYYDLPATIDYILNITDSEDLFFLGHSIGTSIGLITCSLKPQYNSKIRLFLALGPLANVRHTLNPLHKIVFAAASSLLKYVKEQDIHEIMPRRPYFSKIIEMACNKRSVVHSLCLMSVFAMVGTDIRQLNTTTFPYFMQYYPSGTSTSLLGNVVSYYLTGNFSRPDHGSIFMNKLRYNDSVPPIYNLSRVTTPISLHYGGGDFLVTEEDINDLALKLPKVVGKYKVPHALFNHLDFVLAINARTLLYESLLAKMNQYL